MGSKIARKILGALGLSIIVGLIEAIIVTFTLSTILTILHIPHLPPQFATLIRLDTQILFITIFVIGWVVSFVGLLAIIALLLILGFD